mgnify:CR=1 FL=1
MKKLQMPASYALLTEDEQRTTSGGGEFKDALSNFFDNLHLSDFFLGGGLISFSITFVPVLLFKAVRTGVSFAFSLYDQLSNLLGFHDETAEQVQQLAQEQKEILASQTTSTRSMF